MEKLPVKLLGVLLVSAALLLGAFYLLSSKQQINVPFSGQKGFSVSVVNSIDALGIEVEQKKVGEFIAEEELFPLGAGPISIPVLGSSPPKFENVEKLVFRLTGKYNLNSYELFLNRNRQPIEAISFSEFKDGIMILDIFISPKELLDSPEEERAQIIEAAILRKISFISNLYKNKGENTLSEELNTQVSEFLNNPDNQFVTVNEN